jgi:gamma-glutamylputrescine oxidase
VNPLYRNDAPGTYPASWYAATADIGSERAPLDGDVTCDVAIVGAGYTGLSAALHAAGKGLDVVVIDAHRVGFGASGRNGGQVGTGWRLDQHWLVNRLGADTARKLWDVTEDAKALTRELVAAHAPEARYMPGVMHGEWTEAGVAESRRYSDWLRENYDYETEFLDRDGFRAICNSSVYQGGVMDRNAGHVHPLRYVLGLGRAAEAAGARIFEMTEATALHDDRVETPKGTIRASHIVVAANGYLPNMSRFVNARVMPINSFIAATEPLGDRAKEVLSQDVAVADDKFVVNYFRLSEDGRLLFGGRENYGLGFPADIVTVLRARMERLFPSLAGVGIDYTWGGTLGITLNRMPMLRRIGPRTLAAGGFSGHGVAISAMTGKIMAEAIAGDAGRFDLMSSIPIQPFPGGRHARAPLLTLAMTWFSLRDRLGI